MNHKISKAFQSLYSAWKAHRHSVKKASYTIIFFAIIFFLIDQGKEPWTIAFENWLTFMSLTATTTIGLVVQAKSFSAISIKKAPPLLELIRIWSLSSIISVIAPFFAGITTRTALLIEEGMTFKACLSTSVRQAWLGMEYALLAGAVTLPFLNFSHNKKLAFAFFLAWASFRVARKAIYFDRLKSMFKTPIRRRDESWFALQILTMSLTFFIGFNSIGAKIPFEMAIAISSITVLASLIAFVPNGLGITDTIWILIATQYGMDLTQSVSLSILLRASHLTGSAFALLASKLFQWFFTHCKNTR
ncbi:flippase-like domain-containing protein [Marinobacter nauticus]|uniref:flippase-like domain-containing protein n=1 Tax=Marinobacter nauticus TaxID=2743 RepID=UPI001D186B60|nr:flippase-like domain-containing protein [Marinobacter nauticus]MCC4270429.1 flippase-like domain-containing protein [Marinobacter nauticus]